MILKAKDARKRISDKSSNNNQYSASIEIFNFYTNTIGKVLKKKHRRLSFLVKKRFFSRKIEITWFELSLNERPKLILRLEVNKSGVVDYTTPVIEINEKN